MSVKICQRDGPAVAGHCRGLMRDSEQTKQARGGLVDANDACVQGGQDAMQRAYFTHDETDVVLGFRPQDCFARALGSYT